LFVCAKQKSASNPKQKLKKENNIVNFFLYFLTFIVVVCALKIFTLFLKIFFATFRKNVDNCFIGGCFVVEFDDDQCCSY
jgi:hypothetical protein